MHEAFDHRRYLIPFRSLLLPHVFTDVLVIGGGVAGLRAAIAAAEAGADVIVLIKDTIDLSSSAWAQGGIAAVLSETDSVEAHVADTLAAGAGLCDEPLVRAVIGQSSRHIQQLIDWGMRFDRDSAGNLSLGREGGHHHHRIAHSDGDATGAELVRTLQARALHHDNIRLFEKCFALDLLTERGNGHSIPGAALGAVTHHPRYGLQIIWAASTILATGGAGQLYRETTNPRVCTGDGLAMAYRAGAILADLEFIQFHPTTLYLAGANRTLITEAVRGEGAHLVEKNGRRFMLEYHEMAELAPRDIVSRAILDRLSRTQEACVYLDARHMGSQRFAVRFPGLAHMLAGFDIDAGNDLIPVRPCAHYTIGGVWTDMDGRTNVPGLLACGEVSCNGLHGANRLASNSLLEGVVIGARTGAFAAASSIAGGSSPRGSGSGQPAKLISDIPLSEHGELDLADVRSSLRSAMWRNVGIERAGPRLEDAQDMFAFWARYTMDKIFDDPAGWEVQNLLTAGALVTRAARWRTETRGVHYRTDFSTPDELLLSHSLWRIGAGEPVLRPAAQAAGAPA